MFKKRGQITIFIIIAVFIVAGTILFFMFRESLGLVQIPANLEPVYNSFLDCVQQKTLTGISLLETHGGYIDVPDFEPGSSYMPFSSQLDFLGNPIPYWYYVSGNNLPKEQVPTTGDMEAQLADFLEGEVRDCNFEVFYDDGFEITLGEPEVSTDIKNSLVDVSVKMPMTISRANESVRLSLHKLDVNSELGELYNSAREIFDYEQETFFLETYGVDVLRLYAPVDGVELSCSPVVWSAQEVFDNLSQGIESNVLALNSETDKYFKLDLPTEHDVRFLNSMNWPSGFEVSPTDTGILVAKTIGNQPGLGALGFCYAPYHYVYNVRYPVLVQVSGDEDIFQFPLAIVINGNKPREALNVSAFDIEVPPICDEQNVPFSVSVYDTELNPVDAEVSYKCSQAVCSVGDTSGGTVNGMFPQCINGFVIAKADGYEEKREMLSVVSSGSASIILDRLYNMSVNLKLDNLDYDGQAVISFISEDGSKTIVYPEQKSVELSEGQYEIQTYIYRNSTLRIGATTKRQCYDVQDTGLKGFLGFTREECFNIDFPEQIISNALAGGGKQNHYVLESELSGSDTIEIRASSLRAPGTIEELQNNYNLFEDKRLGIGFA